jgi:FkbM family methyltransferase
MADPFESGLEATFMREARRAPPSTRIVAIDVGANAGQWSKAWRQFAEESAARGVPFELHIIEPQPTFRASLTQLAASINATFLSVAAAKQDGTAAFHIDEPGSQGASLARQHENEMQIGTVPVRTINLAAYLRRTLSSRQPMLSFLKLDVESLEFSLLPWLLVQGALCDVTHLLIEWHLNLLPLGQRLSGLGLRLGFGALLQEGCATPPRAVYHDEYVPNNFGVPVPGLQDVATEHALWAKKDVPLGVRPSAPTVLRLRADDAFLQRQQAAEQAEEQQQELPMPPRGSFAAAVRAPPRRRPRTPSCEVARRCHGSCRYERLGCDLRFAAASYRQMRAATRVVPRYFDNGTIGDAKGRCLDS